MAGVQVSDSDSGTASEGLTYFTVHPGEKSQHPDCPGPQLTPPPSGPRPRAAAPLAEPRPALRYEVMRRR